MDKILFHEAVALNLIEQLKKGTAPWLKPWKPGDPSSLLPINPLTNKRYKGINTIQLMTKDYSDNRWLTYKQAVSLDAQVRKGEKGTPIQYWKFSEEHFKKDEQGKPMVDEKGELAKVIIRLERPRVFYATVFNATQIEGMPPVEKKKVSWALVDRAEAILQHSGVTLYHSQIDKAFYQPISDSIHLPPKHQFDSAAQYYATALHELSHWTGHESRLHRDLTHPFGSEGYAREELRAEIASMILGEELRIGHNPGQHSAYIKSWIKILEEDPLEIFRAAADAEKIQTYVLELEQKQIQHLEPIVMEGHPFESPTMHQNPFKKEKIWLDIPFKHKETVKQLAGILPHGQKAIEWDKATSRWFANPEANLEVLKPWLLQSNVSEQSSSLLTTEKTWLAIPYEHKDTVKALLGNLADGKPALAWDKTQKCWFAHPGVVLDKIKSWLPEYIRQRQEPALNPIEEFKDALVSLGCIPSANHPIMDGKTHRIEVLGDKNGEKAGFYVGHLDDHPAGYIKNNRSGIEMRWRSKGYSFNSEEKAALNVSIKAKHQARLAELKDSQEQTAYRLKQKLIHLIPVTSATSYLKNKGIALFSGIFTDKDS